ncbi:hypothetical protein BCV69DRAFT_253425 [Microstroma glucosiphilum]|uniref:RTA1-domain-containing protein n=1 Tax=Pseudomicrostroma glucosiphilum TaxID=1684307 RepID=A0A316TZT7_9BASI|nr:hypothetical protein BCV69DRAFT_253425 [Pseudomicrostroma glucosiphilum]PWN18148.1 hypothetical protein BCV69DRAFT_253425 [Pseudomicrostroma glucosiphilum]
MLSSSRQALARAFILISLLSSSSLLVAAETLQSDSILHYVPSLAGNAIIAGFWAVWSILIFFHVFRTRAWWALCLPFGLALAAIAYGIRIKERTNQSSLGLYIVMYLMSVVASPACILAMGYITFGRMVMSQRSPLSILPPRLYTLIFVFSDIFTVLVQAAGGGIQASGADHVDLGVSIFLIGVALQVGSYLFFCALVIECHIKLLRMDRSYSLRRAFCFKGEHADDPATSTARLFLILYFTSIFIIIRLTYRTVENAEGWTGTLNSTEIYSFLLDALPLLLGTSIYIFIWPSKLLAQSTPTDTVRQKLQEWHQKRNTKDVEVAST